MLPRYRRVVMPSTSHVMYVPSYWMLQLCQFQSVSGSELSDVLEPLYCGTLPFVHTASQAGGQKAKTAWMIFQLQPLQLPVRPRR